MGADPGNGPRPTRDGPGRRPGQEQAVDVLPDLRGDRTTILVKCHQCCFRVKVKAVLDLQRNRAMPVVDAHVRALCRGLWWSSPRFLLRSPFSLKTPFVVR